MSTVGGSHLSDQPAAADRSQRLYALTVIAAVAFVVTLLMALFYAGTDSMQGLVQKIFYPHVASFFGAFAAFGAAVAGGIQYLRTRQPRWDALALAGVEVGLALAIINLATGSIWARPIWNTWWTWDPRLTSAAVMALTYAAYLMIRGGIENPETRRRFASVYGILAFGTVIFTTIIIRIRPDTIHPAVIGASPQNAEGGFAMSDTMGVTFAVSVLVWIFLITPALMWWRIRLENASERVAHKRARLLSE